MIDPNIFDNRLTVKKSKLNLLPINTDERKKSAAVGLGRFPSWLHRQLPKGANLWKTSKIVSEGRLNTVCEEAQCPNLLECWSKKTATFLILGKNCTRSCGFCDIEYTKNPPPLDPEEPRRVAHAVQQLGLKHVVITMVARDDLTDQGANHIAKVLETVRNEIPECTLEVLTSDFQGNMDALDKVLEKSPEIFNHNIETVKRLTPRVRHKATYDRTLGILQHASLRKKNLGMLIKSGLMVGLGESQDEVKETLHDLKKVGCDIVTIGQYLQPNSRKLLVKEFIHPDQFKAYEEFGNSLGFRYVFSAPFVRSSYNAGVVLEKTESQNQTINSI
jgi:lipoic acid synthetase